MQKNRDAGQAYHFPQLKEISNEKILTAKLQQRLKTYSDGKFEITKSHLEHVRFDKGRCRILLLSEIKDANSGETCEQLYFGRLFPTPEALENALSRFTEKLVDPAYGPAAMTIPEWSIRLWAYPNDPNLPGLPLLADANRVLNLVKANPEKFGLKFTPTTIEASLAKFVPGRRCSYIYHVSAPDQAGQAADSAMLFAKAYRNDADASYFTSMKSLWESEASRNKRFIVPEPYFFDEKNNIFWQEALTGKALTKMLPGVQNTSEICAEIGRRLAFLHNSSLDIPKKITVETLLKALQKSAKSFAAAFPEYGARCKFLTKNLFSHAGSVQPLSSTTLHASFKIGHILMTEKGVAFIDLDGLCSGTPGQDVGRFAAYLYKMQAENTLDAKTVSRMTSAFVNGYNSAAAEKLTREQADWFIATHLVISELFKSVKRQNCEPVLPLLTIVETICSTFTSENQALPPVAASQSKGVCMRMESERESNARKINDEKMPYLEILTDPERACGLFEEIFHREYPNRRFNIRQCQFGQVYHKPGKNCRMNFYLSGTDDKNQPFEQMFFGKITSRNKSEKDTSASLPERWPGCGFWKPAIRCPEMNLTLFAFPYDPKMPYLGRLFEAGDIRRHIEENLAGFDLDSQWKCVSVKPHIVKYRSGKNCTLRYEAAFTNPAGQKRQYEFYSKTYNSERSRYVYTAIERVYESSSCRTGRINIPRPIAYLDGANTYWQRAWTGVTFTSLFNRRGWTKLPESGFLPKVADLLATLHQVEIPGLTEGPSPEGILANAKGDIADILQFLPEKREELTALLHRLEGAMPVFNSRLQQATIHGTFKIAQLLCRDDQLALVDFDSIALGDPVYDVAEFLTSIVFLRATAGLPAETTAKSIEIFLNAYQQQTDWACDSRKIAWYMIPLLFAKIHAALKRPQANVSENMKIAFDIIRESASHL